jgi:iron complex transport system permease protein
VSTTGRRQVIGLLVIAAMALIVCALRLMVYRDPQSGIEFGWPDADVARFRWTAMSVGLMVGASLGVCGVMLQALLRNPLAEPFILGVSSGAGLGVMAATYVAYRFGASMTSQDVRTIPAMIGALAALAVVYSLGRRRGWLDPVTLVLVGVIVSAVCGAGIMFFQHAVDTGLRGEFTLWLMGFIPEIMNRGSMLTAATLTLLSLGVGMTMGRAMDAATLSDDEARSVGLAVGPVRVSLFVLSGLVAAMTVALAGPIGFVGLVAPHAARLVLGPRHTALVLGAALAGGALVVGADVARQAITIGAGRMPIGIFTAVIGGPAFIWLLLSGRGQS